jgi:hypothetical protein
MQQDELVTKYKIEIARLDELYADLGRLWTKVPHYGWVGLAAPVVWYMYGFGWAVAELLVTGALVGTQAYLIGMRKSENRWTRERLVQDLERREAELARQA